MPYAGKVKSRWLSRATYNKLLQRLNWAPLSLAECRPIRTMRRPHKRPTTICLLPQGLLMITHDKKRGG